MLIIVVGKSGAGKSTFIKTIGLNDYYYEISGIVKQELRKKRQPINHDTIQPIIHQRYEENPYWQTPHILSELSRKGLLIIDGCRSFLELEKLIELCSPVLIVEIRASASVRRKRLALRDGVSKFGFRRIERDEEKISPLSEILRSDLVDMVIMNNGSPKALEVKAKKFALLISPHLGKKGGI